MKIRATISALAIILVAAGCTSVLPMSVTNVASVTPPVAEPARTSSVISATTSPTSLTSGWLTFTNQQGLYSISYPESVGPLIVEYSTRGAMLSWYQLAGTLDVSIGGVDNPRDLTLEALLAANHISATSTEAIDINGMTGVIVTDPAGDDVYLTRDINGFPYIYEIDFQCDGGLEQPCSPPDFWRQMLDSFQPLPANS